MKKNWELEDLIEHFTLLPQEMRRNKTRETRLGFAVLLKYFSIPSPIPLHAKRDSKRSN